LPFVARLKRLNIVNSSVEWVDEAVDPTAHLKPRLDLTLDNVTVGADEGPGEIDLTFNLPDVVKQLNVRGRFKASPYELMANVYVKADDLSGPGLRPYVPGTRFDAASGSVVAKVYASTAPHPLGGTAARLAVNDVLVQDGRSPQPGLKLDNLTLTLDRIDLRNRLIKFDEFTVRGLAVDAVQDAEAPARRRHRDRLGGRAEDEKAQRRGRADPRRAVARPIARADRKLRAADLARQARRQRRPPRLPAARPRRAGRVPRPEDQDARAAVGRKRRASAPRDRVARPPSARPAAVLDRRHRQGRRAR
jgi:hypothetical protein